MNDYLPHHPSYADLPSSHRLALMMEYCRVAGTVPRHLNEQEENAYRRYCGWYLDLNQLGRVFSKTGDNVMLEEWTVRVDNAQVESRRVGPAVLDPEEDEPEDDDFGTYPDEGGEAQLTAEEIETLGEWHEFFDQQEEPHE